MKIVASGDWHPDVFTAGRSRFADVKARVDEVRAVARTADLFIFLGDLANPDVENTHPAVELACETASDLASHGVPSLWLGGNHDVIEDGLGTTTLSALAGIEKGGSAAKLIRVFNKPAASLIDTRTAGKLAHVALPYPSRSCPYDPAAFVEALMLPPEGMPIVVSGHLWHEAADPGGSESTDLARGRSVYWPMDALRKKFGGREEAVFIGGHYHRQGKIDELFIAGSLERLTFGDQAHEPGFLVMEYQ